MSNSIPNFEGKTWVAFTDLCGTKDMYKEKPEIAAKALHTFYNAVFNIHQQSGNISTIVVSDCAIFWLNRGANQQDNLDTLLSSLKKLNREMIGKNYLLRTTIAYGHFKYQQRLEIPGISKNMFVGSAYLDAYANNDKAIEGSIAIASWPKGKKRNGYSQQFQKFVRKGKDLDFWEYFWSVDDASEIKRLIAEREKAYKLTFEKLKEIYQGRF